MLLHTPARAFALDPIAPWRSALLRAGNVARALTRARSYAREVETLARLSDGKLAALGLRRDRIVHHVFGRHLDRR